MTHRNEVKPSFKKLVLEEVDAATDCVRSTFTLDVREHRDVVADVDLKKAASFPIDAELARRLCALCGAIYSEKDTWYRLRLPLPVDRLPYDVHTNRELLLMMQGKKPLAVFACDPSSDAEVPEEFFEPYVNAGRIVREEAFLKVSNGGGKDGLLRFVLYALPQERWRIPAYLLLWTTAMKSGWSEGLTRMEGSLLGYEEWQNNAYIETIYRKESAVN